MVMGVLIAVQEQDKEEWDKVIAVQEWDNVMVCRSGIK